MGRLNLRLRAESLLQGQDVNGRNSNYMNRSGGGIDEKPFSRGRIYSFKRETYSK